MTSLIGFVIVRQLVCYVFPAPVSLVDPTALVKEIAVWFNNNSIKQIHIRDLDSDIGWQFILLEVFFFRRFFIVGNAGLDRKPKLCIVSGIFIQIISCIVWI